MNSNDRRALKRQNAAKGTSRPGGFYSAPEASHNRSSASGCPNFGFLLNQDSTSKEAHAEMMRRARIKV
jgi:hypothetical protein